MDHRIVSAPAVPSAQLLEVLKTYCLELHPDLVMRRAATMRLIRTSEGVRRFVRPLGEDLTGAVLWEEEASHLHQIGSIYTLHRYDFQGNFTATWGEVLAMLPDHMLTRVRAVEVIGPATSDQQLRQHAAREAGLLVALTILYAY